MFFCLGQGKVYARALTEAAHFGFSGGGMMGLLNPKSSQNDSSIIVSQNSCVLHT